MAEQLGPPGQPLVRGQAAIRDVRAAVDQTGRSLVGQRIDELAHETRRLAIGLAAGLIERLLELRGSVAAGSEVFGVPLDDDPTDGWTDAELPPAAEAAGRVDSPCGRALVVTRRAPAHDRGAAGSGGQRGERRLLRPPRRRARRRGERVDGGPGRALRRRDDRRCQEVSGRDRRAGERRAARPGRRPRPAGGGVRGRPRRVASRPRRPDGAGWSGRADRRLRHLRPPGESQFEHLAGDQWELAVRESRQAEHVETGGFCPLHTWTYAEIASPVGIAAAYARLAESAAAALRVLAEAPQGRLAQGVARLQRPERCPACAVLMDAERSAVAELARRQGGEGAPGLCVPHLAAVLATGPGEDLARTLVTALAGALGRASEDMRTFALKRESLRRGLLTEEEQRAHRLTLTLLAGRAGLARPPRFREE